MTVTCGLFSNERERKIAAEVADSYRMDVPSIALQGLDQANAQLDASASAIAGATTTDSNGGIDVVSLSDDMVALISAQNQFAANLATMKSANGIQKSLIDLTA